MTAATHCTPQAGGDAQELLQWEAELLHRKMPQVFSSESHKDLQCKRGRGEERRGKVDCVVFMILFFFSDF